MKIDIIPIGNSKGIRIPKALLKQCGINGSVDISVEGKKLVIRPLKKKPREGWEEAIKASIKKYGHDALVWPDDMQDSFGDDD